MIFLIKNLQGARWDLSQARRVRETPNEPQRIRVYVHDLVAKYSDELGSKVAEGDRSHVQRQ